MPVARFAKLVLDDVADERHLAAAHELADDERRDRRNEHHRDSLQHAGQGIRQRHAQEALHRACAEVGGGLQQAMIRFFDDGVDRHNHKGEIVVDHTEHDRLLVVEEDDLLAHAHARQPAVKRRNCIAQRRDPAVENTRIFQNGHPGIGAQQEVHPHRQNNEHQPQAGALKIPAAEDQRDGIAQQQADDRGEQRDLERTQQQLEVSRFEHAPEIGEGNGRPPLRAFGRHRAVLQLKERLAVVARDLDIRRGFLHGHAVPDHHRQRNGDKENRPEHKRHGKRLIFLHGRSPHTRAACRLRMSGE